VHIGRVCIYGGLAVLFLISFFVRILPEVVIVVVHAQTASQWIPVGQPPASHRTWNMSLARHFPVEYANRVAARWTGKPPASPSRWNPGGRPIVGPISMRRSNRPSRSSRTIATNHFCVFTTSYFALLRPIIFSLLRPINFSLLRPIILRSYDQSPYAETANRGFRNKPTILYYTHRYIDYRGTVEAQVAALVIVLRGLEHGVGERRRRKEGSCRYRTART
jgi:hypothetical protein